MKDEGDEIVRILKITNGRVGGPDGAAARMEHQAHHPDLATEEARNRPA
jgi:hypothetical protein